MTHSLNAARSFSSTGLHVVDNGLTRVFFGGLFGPSLPIARNGMM